MVKCRGKEILMIKKIIKRMMKKKKLMGKTLLKNSKAKNIINKLQYAQTKYVCLVDHEFL